MTQPTHPPGRPPTSTGPGRRTLATALILAIGVGIWLVSRATGTASGAEGPASYGWTSLLPPLVTLALVFTTREVVSSLFAGIVTGGLVAGRLNIVDAFLIPAIGSETFAVILLVYLWALGGLIGLWTRTGGAERFARSAGNALVRGPRTAKLFAWLMGIVFHQGGTISTILAGTTVRPVTDAERVSHEEVSYIVDSTASPIATLIPLNAWPLYVSGLVVGTVPLFPDQASAVSFFFRSIPFNFYAMAAITLTLLLSLDLLPWTGRRMAAARARARDTGQLDRPDAEPLVSDELTRVRVPEGYRPGAADFVVPLAVLIGVALSGVVPGLARGSLADISVPIAEAFGLALMSACILAVYKGMRLPTVVGAVVDGMKGVTIGALIFALAVTLGHVTRTLGTAAYIVDAIAHLIHPVALPAMFLLLCMVVAFSIGSSWGTFAVVFPLAMPLAWAVQPDPAYLSLCFGAVLGGAVFGDQCSPISDTTILSALATGADLMDHVLTQLPLALLAAGVAAVAYAAGALLLL